LQRLAESPDPGHSSALDHPEQPHWVLDVIFRENDWQIRDRVVAHNIALLRTIAINLVRTDHSSNIACEYDSTAHDGTITICANVSCEYR
jgi:hypothetical protein